MEAENAKEKQKKYSNWQKKVDNWESQLFPIFCEPLNTEITSTHNKDFEKFSQELDFMRNLVRAEMASNPTQGSHRGETHHHLADIARRVRTLQSICHAWSTPGPTSTSVGMWEAPRCSNTDPYEDDHVDENRDKFGISYDDHEDHVDGESYNIYMNPVFVGHSDDQHGLPDFEEVAQDDNQDEDADEDGQGEKTVMNDSDTEERMNNAEEVASVDDDQNKVEECEEESRITEDMTRVYYDQKEDITKKAEEEEEEEEEDDYDNEVKPHYCYKVVFWVGLIGMGIISAMAGFSDFPEYHSSVMILTPT